MKNNLKKITKFGIYFILGISLCSFFGCSAATQAVKRGNAQLEIKNYYGATQEYITALNLEADKKEAKMKLCQYAKNAYEQKLSLASNFENTSDYPSALTNYDELNTFLIKVNSFGCLTFAVVNVKQKITEMKSSSSEKFYKQAEGYFAKEEYNNAISDYQQALKYNSPYKDSTDKIAESYYRIAAKSEKQKKFRDSAKNYISAFNTIKNYKDSSNKATSIYYALGQHYLSKGLCRNAINDFRECAKIDPNYKDVNTKINEAEAGAITKIAFIKFDNPTGKNIAGAAIGDLIFDEMRSKLKQNASEFIRIMDRADLEAIMGEQTLGLRGVTDEYASFKQLKGVHYLVFGKLSQVNSTRPSPRRTNKQIAAEENYKCIKYEGNKAYESSCVRKVPVSYTEVIENIALTLTGSIRVLSVSSGEQVVSHNISAKKDDRVYYVTDISRDISNLYGVKEIEKLAKERQELQDEDSLLKAAVSDITSDMSSKILQKIDILPTASDPLELKI